MTIRCIAIDDEPLALTQLTGYIRKTAFLDLAGTFHSATSAARWLENNEIDLIFVDINMPGLNGLDFVRSLAIKPLVVFITAHREYALEGFRVDATDYLLKPIGYGDFLRSAEKAYRQFQLLGGNLKPLTEPHILFVKSDYKVIPVDIESIFYIESRSEYVRIYTENSRPVMSLGSLKSYEEKLPERIFCRLHRSYIVNLNKIFAIERKHVVMPDGKKIPVGDMYEAKFKEYLSETISWARNRSLETES